MATANANANANAPAPEYTFVFRSVYDTEVVKAYDATSTGLEEVVKSTFQSLKISLEEANKITKVDVIGNSCTYDGKVYQVILDTCVSTYFTQFAV